MNKWAYWYFSFEAEKKDRDWRVTDSTVVCAKGELFPVQKVYEYAREEFGDDVKLTILTAFRIPEEDYGYMMNLTGGEEEDGPETGI